MKDLKTSLEYSQSQIETLQMENKELKLTDNTLSTKNKNLKDSILDIQCSSMSNN